MNLKKRKLILQIARFLGIKNLYKSLQKIAGELTYEISQNHINDYRVIGHFVDTRGYKYPLLEGLRDYLKPNWRSMLQITDSTISRHSPDQLIEKLGSRQNTISVVENFINIYSYSLKGSDVLEIGAFDGATAYALASFGTNRVIGSDITQYYLNQTPKSNNSFELAESIRKRMYSTRNAYKILQSEETRKKVQFIEDNICTSSVRDNSFDVILSFEVLEHLTSPSKAFQEMHRILKPGGISFHEYNPFFSITGGHSLCTLDFLWGHARLSEYDFENYVNEFRPNEIDLAISFYKNNLNRMTIKDLKRFAIKEGFLIRSIIPWSNNHHLNVLSEEIINESLDYYPNVTEIDFISPTIWILLIKV